MTLRLLFICSSCTKVSKLPIACSLATGAIFVLFFSLHRLIQQLCVNHGDLIAVYSLFFHRVEVSRSVIVQIDSWSSCDKNRSYYTKQRSNKMIFG